MRYKKKPMLRLLGMLLTCWLLKLSMLVLEVCCQKQEFPSVEVFLADPVEQSSVLVEANQSVYAFDYPNMEPELDEEEQEASRVVWRGQELVSEEPNESYLPQMLSSGQSLLIDYDSYRPVDIPAPAEVSTDERPEGAYSLARRSMLSELGTGENSPKVFTGEQQQQQQHQKVGPQFIKEPASYINYLNSTDLVIPCVASGNPTPTITWWHKSSQLEIGSLLDKRYVRYDNSLVISAFKAHNYEPDIHSTTYKCQASNSLGSIVSGDVVINAVIDQDYQVSVADQFVTVDNDALFRCQLAPQARELFQVVGWLEDGQRLIQAPASSHLQAPPTPTQQKLARHHQHSQRALVLPEGQLYIQHVQLKDTNKSYRCQIKNLLSSKVSLSSLSGRLFVTEANEQSGTSPRIVDAPKSISVGRLNEQILLTCLAQGFPRPQIRWFRHQPTSQEPLGTSLASASSDWIELQPNLLANDSGAKYASSHENSLLFIKSLQPADNRAKFKCLANNTFGMHQADTELRLELWPQSKLVEIEPRLEYINNANLQRQWLQLNCTIRASVYPIISIEWLKNGKQMFSLSLLQYASGQHNNLDQLDGLSSNVSLFDDFAQELSAIEYVLPNEDSPLSLGELLSNDMSEPFGLNHQVERPNQQGNVLLSTTTTIYKLTSDHQDSGASPTESRNRRIRQRVRLGSSKDQLVYQLQFEQVKRFDRGSYQCRVRNQKTILHATAHLLLKDNPPLFVETFTSQLLTKMHQPQASLKCVASGSPLPEVSWTLSGFPVPESSRFRVGDYVTRDGLIVSFVNISNVQVEDGGLYECSASNDVGQLKHSSWLNVTGPLYIRPMPNVSAIAGQSLSIMCPVGGWPIEQISWFHNSSKLPVNHRQKLFPNGTLLVSELNEVTDSGQYSCQAKSSSSDTVALNHVVVSIRVPPVVEPFSFAKSLHRGQRYNIMCTVVRGDLPVSIRWFKDGRPIESGAGEEPTGGVGSRSPGIAVKHLDPYSSTLTFASLQSYQRGTYACEATNEAGRANQSSSLVIHVPPEWRIEPKDVSVTVGKTAVIDCQADAFPAAQIEWRLSQDLFREPPAEFKPIISSLYMRVFENGSLIIYNTQRTDAGYYLCQANNGVGPGLSRVIKLTVHVAAHFKSKIRTELVRRGQAAKLKCESIGDLPIEINWLRDKMPLYVSDEPRYSIGKTMLPDGVVSELTISETDRSDSALITCITQNQYGNDDTNIQLIVQSPPDPPLDIRIHEYEARSVKISWLPAHSGNSPITKYIIMYAQSSDPNSPAASHPRATSTNGQYVNVSISGNESTVTLQALTPLTEYQFYMFALNSLGTSRMANEPIKFRTDDEAPAEPPMFVKAQALSSRSIRVKWRLPERRLQYGSIAGFYVGYKHHRLGGPAELSRDTFVYKTVELLDSGPFATAKLDQECLLVALKRGQKYLITVQAFNSRGAGPASEPIIAETWRIDVPEAPTLRMLLRTTHSIHLAWRPATPNGRLEIPSGPPATLRSLQQSALMMRKNINEHIKSHQFASLKSNESPDIADSTKTQLSTIDDKQTSDGQDDASDDVTLSNEPILGYVLTRRQLSSSSQTQDGQPVEMRLPSDHLSQIVDNLTCGTRYQFNIQALNSVGVSAPSEPLVVKTEGSTPVAPDKSSLLSMNSSSVTINLAAWHNGACSMRSFEVAFRPSKSKNWTPVGSPVTQLESRSSETRNGSRLDQTAEAATKQLAQRSSPMDQPLANNTIILIEDLSSSLNYDIKIVATNEAGTTEAIYTFNTLGNYLGKQDDQQWTSGEFQLSETNLSELLAGSLHLLPWLLFSLFLLLTLSTGCILINRRRHLSSSSCSLSLSSASRSNQSSSNYYTSGNQMAESNKSSTHQGSRCPLAGNSTTQKLHLSPLDESSSLANQSVGHHLSDIYEQQKHQSTPVHLTRLDKSNYAYLNQRPTSLTNTDITGIINGGETEMCLGASALNISSSQPNNTTDMMQINKQRTNQPGYYMSPMLLRAQKLGKSSTLPASCHQQIIQQLIQQHQDDTSHQMIDSIVAANLLQQQQHCASSGPEQSYLSMQTSENEQSTMSGSPADVAALLEQQLQQQVYATVKRGVYPRPQRLCEYSNYQCPTNGQAENIAEQEVRQQQMSMMRCCQPELQAAEQSHLCYHPGESQDCFEPQQQLQSSDYQQLRLIN